MSKKAKVALRLREFNGELHHRVKVLAAVKEQTVGQTLEEVVEAGLAQIRTREGNAATVTTAAERGQLKLLGRSER